MSDERIFISYSTKDGKACADALRAELVGLGFSIWQDLVALKGDADWWSQIENALKSRALQHFILVVTPGALASKVVRQEIRLARQERKTVSPVRGPGFNDLNELPRWIGQVYDLNIPEKCELLKRVLKGPSYQNRVPMMAPEPPDDFVQRPVEFEALKQKLLDAKGDAVAITAALRGAGGYGKTTLAKALAHDPDMADAYFDGILWAELGEKPENLLSMISDLITRLTGTPPGLGTVNAAATALSEALGDRRILLVIDDAWREQDLRPFLEGGRNTTRLITTRRDDILPAKAERKHVDAMSVDEALALLSFGLPPDAVMAQRPALAALAQRLGEWAQLLKLVNGFLCNGVLSNREPLSQAINGVNRRLDLKGLTAFDAKKEADRANAIAKTIVVSLELLDDNERARFAELAIFPEDVDVPLGVLSRLWSETGGLDEIDTEDLARRLQSLSLLLSLNLDRRTFRFHDTVRHFLQERVGKDALAELNKRLLSALNGISGDVGADNASRQYYFIYRLAHLAATGERYKLDALLLDPAWLRAKLEATGSPLALVADFDQFGQGEAQHLLGHALKLTAGICTRDKSQLLQQLYRRLIYHGPAAAFCSAVRRLVTKPAILAYRAESARLGRVHTASFNAIAVLPNDHLVSGFSDETIRLWDIKTGQEVTRIKGSSAEVFAVLPDGHLASGSRDSTTWLWIINVWDLNRCKVSARLEGHDSSIHALAALPDGYLASGSSDSTIRLWDPQTGQEAAMLEVRGGSVYALALLPDGRLASGSWDNSIRLWDLTSGQETAIFQGHRDSVYALAVQPNGCLASGSWDNTIRLWDTSSGREIGVLRGHNGPVYALAVLPDGRIASGSGDNTVRLWDAETGKETARLEVEFSVLSLAALDGNRLAAGDACGRIHWLEIVD